MARPKNLIGLVFSLYLNNKEIGRHDKIEDRLLRYCFVKSTDFGAGAIPQIIVEVDLRESGELTFNQIESLLLDCKKG